MTVEEAARHLGISRSSAYAAARTGELPTLAIGRRRVVPTAALRRLLELDETPAA
jgi:excisionase family DNA binding protein